MKIMKKIEARINYENKFEENGEKNDVTRPRHALQSKAKVQSL